MNTECFWSTYCNWLSSWDWARTRFYFFIGIEALWAELSANSFPFSSKNPPLKNLDWPHNPINCDLYTLEDKSSGWIFLFQRQTHYLPTRVELHCERPTTNLNLTKICARTKILKFWSQIRVTLKVGGRVWLVLGWFRSSMLIWIWPNWPQINWVDMARHLSSNLQTSWICLLPFVSYAWFDTQLFTPKFAPKKSGLVHGITFSRSQLKSAHPHCTVCKILDTLKSLFSGVRDGRWDKDHITAFQGLEDTLACLDATYLNLEKKSSSLVLSWKFNS